MYEEFFKLSCRPFDLAPDPRFIYMTEQHARAVANVRFALMNHDSFVIITGEIGIGKTTILNTVMEELGPDYVTAKLVHTTLSHIELLQALLSEFGMPNYRKKKVMLLDTLRSFFLEQHANGKHVVIIVDEAQNLFLGAGGTAAFVLHRHQRPPDRLDRPDRAALARRPAGCPGPDPASATRPPAAAPGCHDRGRNPRLHQASPGDRRR
ncbi:MAG: AAA family ATPase [Gammaproteobacteria bacterium PRO9]|nr:AAA family ATPase [Gammaproteobacteria bacterium PRO9]